MSNLPAPISYKPSTEPYRSFMLYIRMLYKSIWKSLLRAIDCSPSSEFSRSTSLPYQINSGFPLGADCVLSCLSRHAKCPHSYQHCSWNTRQPSFVPTVQPTSTPPELFIKWSQRTYLPFLDVVKLYSNLLITKKDLKMVAAATKMLNPPPRTSQYTSHGVSTLPSLTKTDKRSMVIIIMKALSPERKNKSHLLGWANANPPNYGYRCEWNYYWS
jgi:hypothetical protein